MAFCETATWAHCSPGCLVADLVSLHSFSPSREGVCCPSGGLLFDV